MSAGRSYGEGSQRAQDVLTCRLCSQYLREPRQLPCGHSFCLQCLERYYRSECQRSETGRRRSPSVERRRRGLLPCPAAPVCLHVALVPDDGVAAFPINQKIADLKEHVVNEMAHSISQKLGRTPPQRSGWAGDTADVTSVRSDETDFTDVSAETTWSAPATGSTDHTPSKSPYPNLAKYAKYFEAEKDSEGGVSLETSPPNYTPGRWSERRRVAISSSFQHRRRRVHTPSPAAFDDSTQRPSRCESAPHLNSEGIYRPTVKPRQGSSIASPLLRRATRPASCIIEELADDYEFLNHFDESTTRPSGIETERRAASSERRRQPPPFREHVVLPTHRENISMDEAIRSKATQAEPTRHNKHQSDDVKTGSSTSKTAPGKAATSSHNKHQVDKQEANKKFRNTETIPAPAEQFMNHHKQHSDHLAMGVTSNNAAPVSSQPDKHVKNYSNNSTNFSTTPTHTEPASSSKSLHSDNVKAGKASSSVSSRPGRRLLPNIPTDSAADAEPVGSAVDRVHSETTMSDVHHHARRLPNVDKLKSTEHQHEAGVTHQQKDAKTAKSLHANISDAHKLKSSPAMPSEPIKSPRSASLNLADAQQQQQKRPDGKLASTLDSSGSASVKSSSSSSVYTKPSVSAKSHGVDRSKPSVSSTSKFSSREAFVSQKAARESKKSSADDSVSRSSSAATANEVPCSERAKSSQQSATAQTTPSRQGSKSVHKDDRSHTSVEQKKTQSLKSPTGAQQSPSSTPSKSQASKSTPGSGSRLTYKVNAATIQPVLMNRRKTEPNSATGSDAEGNTSHINKIISSENAELQDEDEDDDVMAEPCAGKPSEQTASDASTIGQGMSDGSCHDGSFIDKEATASVPHSSPLSQTDANTGDQSAANNVHAGDHSPQPTHAQTAADEAGTKEDAKNSKKKQQQQQQWNEFMAILQSARAKYSSTDVQHSLSSEGTTRMAPVYSDDITPCWRIHRDDFAVPTSIAIASDGSAIIADIANCLLDFVDTDGNIEHSVTGTKPFSVALGGKDGNVYVGDRRSRTVRVFDAYGGDVAQWDAESIGFGWIAGIAMLRSGQLAIVDRERCKVGIYSAGGERVTEFGSYGAKDAQLCMADFVAVDSHGRVIVADSGNHRLKMFDPTSGKLVACIAGRGNANGCLLWPKGVAVDVADRIIVADSGNDRVSQFAEDGRFISHLLTATSKPYHVSCGGDSLLGVTHFELSGTSQVDVFTIASMS